MKYLCKDLKQTARLAKTFAKGLRGGEIITLKGDLGTGKTTFTGYVLRALGVESVVSSPTFTILKIYTGKKFNFFHFDAYRINTNEAIEAGFDEIITHNEKNIIFIEWAENIAALVPQDAITINFNFIDENKREIEIL